MIAFAAARERQVEILVGLVRVRSVLVLDASVAGRGHGRQGAITFAF